MFLEEKADLERIHDKKVIKKHTVFVYTGYHVKPIKVYIYKL